MEGVLGGAGRKGLVGLCGVGRRSNVCEGAVCVIVDGGWEGGLLSEAS